MAAGRPAMYTKELGQKICDEIANSSIGLKHILDKDGMPDRSTFYRWLTEHPELRDMYTRAREDQADLLAEEILDIADDGSNDLMTIVKGDSSYEVENKEVTNRSKLRVEARKWLAAKLKPKKYGDRHDEDDKPPIIIPQITINYEPQPSNGKQPVGPVLQNNEQKEDEA